MSPLQTGLLAIGLLLLLVVAIYNAWSTRKNHPKTMRERGPAKRIEPGMHATSMPPEPDQDELPPEAPVVERPLPTVPVDKRPGLDDLIDSIASLIIEGPVSGDALLAAMPSTRRVGSKPFAVEGLNDNTQEWEIPKLHERYSALQVGIQLANRSGPLNEIEFSEFVVKTQAYADAIGAAVDFPDMRTEVARARELDAFASAHDAQLGFVIRAGRAAWSLGFVVQTASQQGFVAGAIPGRLVLPSSQEGAAPLLSLVFDSRLAMAEDSEQTAVREVQLVLEVTRVPREEQAFAQMCHLARSFAQTMEGLVTDENGHLISVQTQEAIGRELESVYDELDARDLSAGSDQARRLFA